MSQYYKPHRKVDWNYGGPRWRLSRSKIDLFIQCPRCFYIDNKLGTARPPGFPFNLNSAVDKLLKKEFDIHRNDETPHPLMDAYGVDAVPFQHEKMDVWRENFKGVDCFHKPTGFTVSGAIDDVWVNPAGSLHIVDYKATSKDEEVTLDAEWQDGYKRQMEIYQWLFRQNGFIVSDTGYFVYANGKTDVAVFDGKLEFDIKVIPYVGNANWIDDTLLAIYACLNQNEIPKNGEACDYCTYRKAVGEVLQPFIKKDAPGTKEVSPKSKGDVSHEQSLFS
ncbi:hypothetical protein EPO56_00970 [Patescibacteria group bacterium]|nr:MAG: hypothetical protein EPO56_00970 [Patescibacteria group bacterium]